MFEVAGGLGYAIGPPVGGILYKVRCVSSSMRLFTDLSSSMTFLVFCVYSMVDSRCRLF